MTSSAPSLWQISAFSGLDTTQTGIAPPLSAYSGAGTSSTCSDFRGSFSALGMPSNIAVSSAWTVTPR